MTILNAWVRKERAIVLVDTDAQVSDGTTGWASKMHVLPHLNAILAARGSAQHSAYLMGELNMEHRLRSFDELLEQLPARLSTAAMWGDLAPHDPRAERGLEMLAVGWSDQRGSIAGRWFQKRGAMQEFQVSDLVDVDLFTPYDPDAMPAVGTVRMENFGEQLVRAQVRWFHKDGIAAGGKILACHITKRAMLLEHVYSVEREALAA